MPRLLFEKKGQAIWISHLDLMRLFQRAFKRAALPLTHTHGFNPRPSVSIALPLSVGVQSECELLDFALDGVSCTNEEIRDKLNCQLVKGITVKEVYDGGRKVGELSLLSCNITLEYQNNIPENAAEAIRELFERKELILPKKTKSGIQDQDIIPMIKKMQIQQTAGDSLSLDCLICCQNPTLNPNQLLLAITTFLPEFSPDFTSCTRKEVFDAKQTVFR